MTSFYVLNDQTPWDEVIATINKDEDQNTSDFKQVSLQLTVEISRNTKILEKLFYIPLLRTDFIGLKVVSHVANVILNRSERSLEI